MPQPPQRALTGINSPVLALLLACVATERLRRPSRA